MQSASAGVKQGTADPESGVQRAATSSQPWGCCIVQKVAVGAPAVRVRSEASPELSDVRACAGETFQHLTGPILISSAGRVARE